jgi:putative membrane protein
MPDPDPEALENSDRPDGGEPTPARAWKRTVALGVLLPLVTASVLIWSATGRQDNLDRVPVAIVNNDKIITGSQPMAAGRSLTAALTHPKSSKNNLKWTLTDKKEADAGLRKGTFYAVLTIPSDFSSAILSSGTDKPQQGKLQLVSNAAASTTVPYISQQIASAAGTSLGDQTTQGYLKNVYGGFNTLAKNSQSAASSASQLADGTDQLSSAAAKLDKGAGSLAGSLTEVASGAENLASGTRSVSSGAGKVDSGATDLAQGSAKLQTSAKKLSGASQKVARKSDSLAGAAHGVARGTKVVSLGVRGVSGLNRLLAAELARLSDVCVARGGSVVFCRRLARTHDHAVRLAAAAGRLRGAADEAARGSRAVADGTSALSGGTSEVADGNEQLNAASDRLSGSARQLEDGAHSVARGAAGLVTGADQLASGAKSSAAGGASLASGSSSLASSASKTDSGARSLSSGLAKAAKNSPTYSTSQQNALAPVVSEPVQLATDVQHSEHGNGWLIALIVAVILWLATLVAALSLDVAAVLRNALAPVSSRRIAVSQAVPVVGFAVLQAAAVFAAVLVFHPKTAEVVPLALLTLVAALAFSLLALALYVGLSRAGVTVFVLLLVLQLAASGNVIPLETAPAVLRTLNGVLPLTAYVNGASQLVSGGQAASLVEVGVVLVLWGAGSAFALLTAVKRRRRGVVPARGQVLEHA